MKRVLVLVVVALFVLWVGPVLAADEVAIEEIQSEVNATKEKADGNNSRIQALEAEDAVLWDAVNAIPNVAGKTCPDGEYSKGFDATGNIICSTPTGNSASPTALEPRITSASASPRSSYQGANISFDVSIMGGKAPLTYFWDFGDGLTSTVRNPNHKYEFAETYTASITVTDDDGKSDTATMNIEILTDSLPFILALTATPDYGPAPLQVQFDVAFADGDAPFSYKWDFGDGIESTTQNPIHIYENPGGYLTQLELVDRDGDVATSSVFVDVGFPP